MDAPESTALQAAAGEGTTPPAPFDSSRKAKAQSTAEEESGFEFAFGAGLACLAPAEGILLSGGASRSMRPPGKG